MVPGSVIIFSGFGSPVVALLLLLFSSLLSLAVSPSALAVSSLSGLPGFDNIYSIVIETKLGECSNCEEDTKANISAVFPSPISSAKAPAT